MQRGTVFVVSAPSGSGKSTLVADLLKEVPDLFFSVSYTTRGARGSETNGVDYFFVTEEKFKQMIAENRFVEYAKVFDHYYGTAKDSLDRLLEDGKDVLLDIDTEGAVQVKRKLPQSVSIFIAPPSFGDLRRRLKSRGQDSEEVIAKRLRWAGEVEIHRYINYDYLVINDDLALSRKLMKSIIYAERSRRDRMAHKIASIIKTFGGV